jgi:hypothetical protein
MRWLISWRECHRFFTDFFRFCSLAMDASTAALGVLTMTRMACSSSGKATGGGWDGLRGLDGIGAV